MFSPVWVSWAGQPIIIAWFLTKRLLTSPLVLSLMFSWFKIFKQAIILPFTECFLPYSAYQITPRNSGMGEPEGEGLGWEQWQRLMMVTANIDWEAMVALLCCYVHRPGNQIALSPGPDACNFGQIIYLCFLICKTGAIILPDSRGC